jgi:hypothetical protein
MNQLELSPKTDKMINGKALFLMVQHWIKVEERNWATMMQALPRYLDKTQSIMKINPIQ